jgi:hypothetical protein
MKPSPAILLAAAALAGCDRLTADTVMVATLVESPKPLGTGSAVLVAQLFIGQHQGALTSPPSQQSLDGLACTTVSVSWPGASVALQAVAGQPGAYAAVSALRYAAGAGHTFTAACGGETYTATVEAAPGAAQITSPPAPASTFASYAGAPDPVTLAQAGTAPFPVSFYAVYEGLDPNASFDPNASPTCTNLPADAAGWMQLALDDQAWRQPSFALPKGTCFPGIGGYLVALGHAKAATRFSSNLSYLSAAFVGSSDGVGVAISGP